MRQFADQRRAALTLSAGLSPAIA